MACNPYPVLVCAQTSFAITQCVPDPEFYGDTTSIT